MSQQPWGGQRPVYPRLTPAAYATGGPSPYPTRGFSQPGFGGGIPQYGPPPVMPGPRRRRPLRLLLLAVMLVGLLTLIGLVVVGLTSGGASVAYQNDDYQVPPADASPPPLPVPQTYAEAEQWTTTSPFYSQVAPVPVRCNSKPINVTTAPDDQLDSHFEGLMECLVRVWQPPVENAGFTIVRPSVTIYGDRITTKCGTSEVNAFYCSADQQVYYSNLLPQALTTAKENKWTADVVMAHEFAHALQGRAGILISAHALGQESGDKNTDLQFSRRLETQADCLSGMFIRAVSSSLGVQQEDLDGILDIYVEIGDDTLSEDPQVVGNHGLARSRKYWGTLGLGTSEVGRCNSFVAKAALVR